MAKWTETVELRELHDLADGDSVTLELENESGDHIQILLIKDLNSPVGWRALRDICSHDGAPLGYGTVDIKHCEVECPRHGARFNLQNGQATRMPAVTGIPVYEVKIEEQKIFIRF